MPQTRPVRIAVVEDEPSARAGIVAMIDTIPGVEVVAQCGDGEEAVKIILDRHPDLVLLDIQLPELTGFEVIEAVGSDQMPPVVFITAYDDFAIQAFEAEAVDYVLKPFGQARLTIAVTRALARLRRDSAPPRAAAHRAAVASVAGSRLERFVVRLGRTVTLVPVDEVDWIDVADNYLRLHCADRAHLARKTLAETVPRLDPTRFLRINRGLVVNVTRIRKIERQGPAVYRLTMADGAILTNSRTYSAAVRTLLA